MYATNTPDAIATWKSLNDSVYVRAQDLSNRPISYTLCVCVCLHAYLIFVLSFLHILGIYVVDFFSRKTPAHVWCSPFLSWPHRYSFFGGGSFAGQGISARSRLKMVLAVVLIASKHWRDVHGQQQQPQRSLFQIDPGFSVYFLVPIVQLLYLFARGYTS